MAWSAIGIDSDILQDWVENDRPHTDIASMFRNLSIKVDPLLEIGLTPVRPPKQTMTFDRTIICHSQLQLEVRKVNRFHRFVMQAQKKAGMMLTAANASIPKEGGMSRELWCRNRAAVRCKLNE